MSAVYRHGRPTIGVLAGWQFYRTATNLSYLKPVFNGINHAARALGCNVFFGCGMGASASPQDPIRPAWPIPAPDVDNIPISPLNTDGLIVFNPLHSEARSQYIQDLIRAGHPVLFIGSGEPGPTLAADNAAGVLEAVQHLAGHGHRRIAFLAGSPDDLGGDTGERLRAYEASLAALGLEQDSQLVAFGRHVYDGGYSATRQILASGAGFTAILSSNDEMALGAMQALKEAGVRVPQDAAVIGVDNRLEGAAHDPALTSVYVPLFTMGRLGVELLLRQFRGQAELPGRVNIPTRLIVRESCGCHRQSFIPYRTRKTALPAGASGDRLWTRVAEDITAAVLSQAHSFGEEECLDLARSLADAFRMSEQPGGRAVFSRTLAGILERTITGEDDAGCWQEAIPLLARASAGWPERARIEAVLDEAHQMILAYLKRQLRQYIASQRWTSSRLSLLTASLITALDEEQVYRVLARHLPDMGIHFGFIVLFEPEGSHTLAWSTARNMIDPGQAPIRFPTQEFPPAGLLSQEAPFALALIPLVHRSGQLGFAVFETQFFDLYGSIVQQTAGALNTAQLYRQAMEGRRLAEEANRMKSRFLSTISHELRTPLNLIVGLSGMLLRDSEEPDALLPEAKRKDIDRIHAYSQHLGGLIGDVIDLAASDAGRLRLNLEAVDLGQALRLVADSGRQLAADKGLAWEADLPEAGPWVWGDQTRLRQVALNLINNAIKFTSHGGVSLRLAQSPGSVTVTVQDTGLGIPLKEQQAIFDEFRQSERSVARGYGGLGLGLAICKLLVETHGGRIAVQSAGEEGSGSVFSFTLPTIQPHSSQAAPENSLAAAGRGVVILTNQLATSQRLCDHLLERGFSVEITFLEPGIDWRTGLEEHRPEAMILDVSTDPTLGWEGLKEIKASPALAGVPVMFFAASQLDSAASFELDYLTKPIEISRLTRALDQHWLMVDSDRTVRNILVVDDEPDTLEMHARIVQVHSASNRVFKARNGREALNLLSKEIVDLVLLDLQMPEMDGFEVLETMRSMESTRRIPVIVVTGKVLTSSEMDCLNQGVAAVLEKGLFSAEETIAHITAALENKRRLSGEARRLVRQAMAFLHQNYGEPIARREIARQIGITEDHLTFCFRQELGVTPIEYLQRYRIHQARRLLKESTLSITEIALSVGFSDSGYFSRIFRRETGVTPEAFRRSAI